MSGINVWELAQYNKEKEYNRFETTNEVSVNSTRRSEDHNENAICFMLHTINHTTILEIRGFDTEDNRFSYKFQCGTVQPISMRAVNGHGEVEKLIVSTEKKPSGITLRRHKQKEEDKENV